MREMSVESITAKSHDFSNRQKAILQASVLLSMFLFKVCTSKSLDLGDGLTVNYNPSFSTFCYYSDDNFQLFSGLTIDECVKECSLRLYCRLLQYKRKLKVCELYANMPKWEYSPGCVHVLRQDMTIPQLPCPGWCNYETVCDLDTQDCVYLDCLTKPSVQDGTLLGNLNSIGSKLKLECAGELGVPQGANTITTCQQGGLWTPLPLKCIGNYWFQCPSSDVEYTVLFPPGGGYFKFRFVHEVMLSYQEAFQYCLAEGGHFIQEFPEYMKTFFLLVMQQCSGYQRRYWIDGTNLAASNFHDVNQWITSTGDPLVSDFWYPGQPNHPATDHCAYLYMEESSATDLICDWTCNTLYHFVCEI